MNRYNNAKIYKLVNNSDSEIYVGSTCLPLSKRKSTHKDAARKYPTRHVYEHLNQIGWNNVRIIQIETVNAETKDQLLMREQHYIDTLNPSLNKLAAFVPECPHGKEKKSECKDCGGTSICWHNRRKSECKDCGGSQICEHNRIKSSCKDCDGSQICEHNRVKSRCKDCGGGSICVHNRRKQTCIDCNGDKYYCYECEKAYCGKRVLDRHINGIRHKKKYIQLMKEVFDHEMTIDEVPLF